jgi:hypothetical protein
VSESNGHSKKPIDKGLRTEEPKLCGNRLPNNGWCQLINEHDGICDGLARPHGPIDSLWHRHRGQIKVCGKVTGPATMCSKQRGHSGVC